MNLQRTILASAWVVLFATASLAQQVKTASDPEAAFNQYKTYSWETVQTDDTQWVDRIKEAVNSALTAKGWRPVESGGDVAVVAIETTQNRQTLDTFYDGYGRGWDWRGLGDTIEKYEVGTLVVDLFDAKTQKLIFRASSSDTLSNKSDKNVKDLDKGVQKMFGHFPPDLRK